MGRSVSAPLAVLAQVVAPPPTPQYANVLTHHNDNARTGANLNENVLNVATVSMKRFGRLFERKVNGAVYAQPLYVHGLNVSNSVRNVLYVATMRNMVYAFDADSPGPNAPLWGPVSLGPPVHLPDGNIGGGTGYKDIEWEVGVLGTPVIDLARNALYAVAATKEVLATTKKGNVAQELYVYRHRLHKLDLGSGALTSSQPIAASADNVCFRSDKNIQRPGLVLANGRIYAAFASYADVGPEYHGWIIAFDPGTLAQTGEVFCTTPMGNEGGIWMSGEAPAVDDAGNLYFMTGNGSFNGDTTSPPTDFSTCFVKLTPSLQVASWFSPYNNADLGQGYGARHDIDLGSAGVLLLPNTSRLVGGGKEGKFYLLDRAALGGFHAGSDSQIPQSFYVFGPSHFPFPLTHHIHGCPTVWTGPMGMWVYVWPENDSLRAYSFASNRFTANAQGEVKPAKEATTGNTLGMPGGFLSISANGAAAGSGILWANHPWEKDTDTEGIVEGVLRAYDASNLQELWNSRTNRARDDFGNFAKFCPPTVTNGRVYLPTMGGLHRKVTMWYDSALGGVALTSLDDNLLVMGWTGVEHDQFGNSSPGHLNVWWSDDAINWPGTAKATNWNEVSWRTPALTAGLDRGRLFMAWTGTDGRLNVHSSYDRVNWFNKRTLGESSDNAPALAFGNRLFLAWTDAANKLNVMSSVDGLHWDPKVTLNYTSPSAPGLAFFNGTLFLLWSDFNHRLNLMRSVDGVQWIDQISFDETSEFAPAMALDDNTPFLCWTERDPFYERQPLQISQMTPRDGDPHHFTDKRTFRDKSLPAPTLAEFQHRMYVGWTGTDGHPNVAVLSLGGVSTYGPLKA